MPLHVSSGNHTFRAVSVSSPPETCRDFPFPSFSLERLAARFLTILVARQTAMLRHPVFRVGGVSRHRHMGR